MLPTVSKTQPSSLLPWAEQLLPAAGGKQPGLLLIWGGTGPSSVRYVLPRCQPAEGGSMDWVRPPPALSGIYPLAQGWLPGGACDPGRVPVGTEPSSRLCPSHHSVVQEVESCILFHTGTHKVDSWCHSPGCYFCFFSSWLPLRYSRGPVFFNNCHQSRWLCTVRGRALGSKSASFHWLGLF